MPYTTSANISKYLPNREILSIPPTCIIQSNLCGIHLKCGDATRTAADIYARIPVHRSTHTVAETYTHRVAVTQVRAVYVARVIAGAGNILCYDTEPNRADESQIQGNGFELRERRRRFKGSVGVPDNIDPTFAFAIHCQGGSRKGLCANSTIYRVVFRGKQLPKTY